MKTLARSVIAAMLLACFNAALFGQPQGTRSLEEELLEELRSDPMDEEIHDELFAPGNCQTDPEEQPGPSAAGSESGEIDRELLGEMGSAATSGHPLVDVARQMRSVEQRIGKIDTGSRTQDLQQQIVSQLEKLLKQARKQCSGGGKPSDRQPQQVAERKPDDEPKQGKKPGEGTEKPSTKPPKDPRTKPGTAAARRPDMEAMRALIKEVWGELPPGEREQMLELPIEEFLPKYELLIEAYFKRLAEQQEVDRWPSGSAPPR